MADEKITTQKLETQLLKRFLGYPVSENSATIDAQLNQGLEEGNMQLKNMNRELYETSTYMAFTNTKAPKTNTTIPNVDLAKLDLLALTNTIGEAYKQNCLFRDSFNAKQSDQSASHKQSNRRR